MDILKKIDSGKILTIIAKAIIIICSISMIFPFLWMFFTSFKTPEEAFSLVPTLLPSSWSFSTYVNLMTEYPFISATIRTLIVEVSVIVIGTFVTTLAAFAFAKMRMKNKKLILMVLLSSMMIPYATIMLPQYRAFQSLGMTDTLWPLILPGFFGNITMMFFLIQYMRGIPTPLIEAAKIDGASYFQIFYKIIVPLAKPAIAAQIIFWFVGIWNDYFAPSIYLTSQNKQTLQVLIASLNSTFASGTNYPLIMTGAFLASIPMLLIFIVFQKYFISTSVNVGVIG